MSESTFAKRKAGTWSASAPVPTSIFKQRGFEPSQETTDESEAQLPDLQPKRPSFLQRLAIYPPQAAPSSSADAGNIQRQSAESEKDDEHLQTKPDIQRQEEQPEEKNEELQMKPLAEIRRQAAEEEKPEEDLQTKRLPEIQHQEAAEEKSEEELQTKPLAELQRQEAPDEKDDENLQMKPLAQVQLQEAEEEKPEELQAKPLGEIQRQEGEEKKDDENLQMKPLAQIQLQETEEEKPEDLQTKPLANIQRQEAAEEPEEIQTKLTVGAPGDKYEQEADQMAAKVMAMPSPETPQLIQRQTGEEEEVQMKPLAASITPLIQRQTAEDEAPEEVQMLQRKAGGSFSASSNVESSLNGSKGGGSPLTDNVRGFMEPRFGADFSSVRVHTDSTAVQMNKELGAQAFTHGNNIYYGAGKSPGNNELTAHELTHTIQQKGAKTLNSNVRLRLKQQNHDGQSSFQEKSQLEKSTSQVSISKSSPNSEKFSNPASKSLEQSQEVKTNNPSTQQKNEQEPLKDERSLNPPSPTTEVSGLANKEQTPLKPQQVANVAISPETAGSTAGTGSPVTAMPVSEAPAEAPAQASEGEAATVGEDPALEQVATATEGVDLPANDRAKAVAALSEVSAEGSTTDGGGGGGGGGAAIEDKPVPPVPDVSSAEPAQALAVVSQLPPAQLQAGLSGVTAAVNSTVGKQRAELAANPPQMERPSGSPINKEGSASDRTAPPVSSPKPVEKAPAGQSHPVPLPQPLPPLAPSPVQSISQPSNDPQAIKASLDRLPTRDPSLNITAGSAPPLELKGDADPNKANEQKIKLEKSVADTHTKGQQELAQPMGENEIYPNVPKETLKAEAIGGGNGSNGAVAAKGAAGDEAISVIAQQEHGAEIQSAVGQAQAQMSAKKQDHVTHVAQEKEKSNKEIAKFQSDNEAQQGQERAKAQTEVKQQRDTWNKEQTALVEKSRKDGDVEVAKGMKLVQQEQTQAETKASQHIDKGNQEAETARKQGETQATAEKQKADKESGGIFGWLADKAKAFFDGIKQAIQKAFEIARTALKAAIETAKKLATEAIEAARKAIVSVIKAVGEALIAIGNVLLAAFPGLRDRFRNAIKSVVQKAEAAVNFLAEKLKQGVQAALNLLGKGLDAALGLMEKGMLAAVDAANAATKAAISAAKAAVEALGAFAVLAKDIGANPGQWLSNLGAGVMDGIKNHLWTALQAAIKEWFNQKLEQVLGLGMAIWKLLSKGGINLLEVGKMAWEAIKAAIPPALIQILIEQLVVLIVPAAGLVLKIIEGLQAAWGTVSRILQAMQKFITFLKAVKSGQSGPQFGQLLAAAGVILIDFVANWLLKRVRGAASKVAGKIREIAKKIGNGLKGTFAKLKKGLGKLGERFFGKRGDKNGKGNQQNRDQAELKKKQKRVDRAVGIAVIAVNKLTGKPVGKAALTPILNSIKVIFGLKVLEPIKQGGNWAVHGEINPESTQPTKVPFAQQTYNDLKDKEPCFPPGTPVKTPIGDRNIEDLIEGDLVFAYDLKSQAIVERPVLKIYKNWTRHLVNVDIEGETLTSTRLHPFWAEEKCQWISACSLRNGMTLRSINSSLPIVQHVETYAKESTTYNLEIYDIHNYFVGLQGILVHNGKPSKFQDTSQTLVEIYEIVDRSGKVVYTGQTDQGVIKRFQQHCAKKPHWIANGYTPRSVRSGNWTPYEATIWEQHYLDKHGGKQKLENKINAITPGKYAKYKNLHNPCP